MPIAVFTPACKKCRKPTTQRGVETIRKPDRSYRFVAIFECKQCRRLSAQEIPYIPKTAQHMKAS